MSTGTADGRQIGKVTQLWRHPAKSMMGETVSHALIERHGMVGDRTWAVRDEVRGGIQGARKLGGLMRLKARYQREPSPDQPSPPVEITLPDGTTTTSGDPEVNKRLTDALDHEVTLWPLLPPEQVEHYRRAPMDSDDVMVELRTIFGRTEDEPLPDLSVYPPEIVEYETPPGNYYDVHPLMIMTTTSLASLQELAPESKIDVRRFRPNIVIELDDDAAGAPFPEQDWIGRQLLIGDAVIDLANPCARCVMITRDFDDLPQDRNILRKVVREANQNLGVYADVATRGAITAGDPVILKG